MENQTFNDLSKFFTGPDLLLQNTFRLAQMPVDTTERNLNKRQQMIEMADKMGIPHPPGESPIFAIPAGNGHNGLKESLHRLRDPLNRIFDEMFWFWPHCFEDSISDKGLKLLEQNKVQDAIKHWMQGEQQTENFVSTHNLALLHQFIALQMDDQKITPKNEQPGCILNLFDNKDEKASIPHWNESFNRWHLLSKQDSFWNFLKMRIRSINDPRLPLETAEWLRENITAILFSVNAGLIVSAAEKKLHHMVEHQRAVINNSGFDSKQVDDVFDTFSRKYVQTVHHLCKIAEKEAKDDPVKANISARRLSEQAAPLLQTLAMIFSDSDKSVNVLHDEVAETILRCQIPYGRKTENWTESKLLLELAWPMTRGTTAKNRIEDNIKQVQDLLKDDNNWCQKRYFDLPQECIDLLEKARAFEEKNQFDEAIDLLRNALFGLIDLPDHPDFQKQLCHCISYCFKSRGGVLFNKAFAEFNSNINKLMEENILYKGTNQLGQRTCVKCGLPISPYENYMVLTYQEEERPFHNRHYTDVKQKREKYNAILDKAIKESLDYSVLSLEFDPEFKFAIRNHKVIRKAARESNLKDPSPAKLKKNMNLVSPDDLIRQLISSANSDDKIIFSNLTKIIVRQNVKTQTRTLSRLFLAALANDKTAARALPYFNTDQFILNKFMIFGVSVPDKLNHDMARKLMIFLLGSKDHNIHSQAMEYLQGDLENSVTEIFQAAATMNQEQAKPLCQLIDRITKEPEKSESIDIKSCIRLLMDVQLPNLSNSIFRLYETKWPSYDKMMMDKQILRDLKYLFKNGNDQQRSMADHLLNKMRSRGIWSRFKVWQWKSSSTFEHSAGKGIWWAR